MPALLLWGDTVRSAALRHEVPLVVVDPFLLVDDGPGRRWVMSSALEAARLARVRPDVEQVAVTDLGFRELLESGLSRPQLLLELASRVVARTGVREALVHGDLPVAVADRLRAGPGRPAAPLNAMGEPTPGTLAELIAFNERHRGREMPYFGQEIFVQSQARGPLTSPAYRRALAANHRLAGAQGIDAALAARRVDVLVAPTNGPAWSIDLVTGDHFGGGYSSPSAVAGYPHVTVPAGYVQGLPVGLSFFAGRFTDARLLAYAYAFEQATRQRRAPEFRSTLLA